MNFLQILPHLNASLNALSGVFLISGFYFIRRKQISKHRFCMISACSVSALFLVSYIIHHSIRTYYFGIGPTRFTGEGVVVPIYRTILLTHTVLATAIAPFVLVTLWRGLKGRYDTHKKLARWVFPIWLYVSITGVVVYLMLYQLFPAK